MLIIFHVGRQLCILTDSRGRRLCNKTRDLGTSSVKRTILFLLKFQVFPPNTFLYNIFYFKYLQCILNLILHILFLLVEIKYLIFFFCLPDYIFTYENSLKHKKKRLYLNTNSILKLNCILTHSQHSIEDGRGAVAQSVPVNATGCGFDSHSKK